jgi:putative chitinase
MNQERDLADIIESLFVKFLDSFSLWNAPHVEVQSVVEVKEEPIVAPKNDFVGLTEEQLKKIMPRISSKNLKLYLSPLNSAMKEFEINTPQRITAFVAQLAHESMEFKYFEEIASGEAYEGRKDLGNVIAGDGKRYKGRGPIQLTGRTNYRDAGRDLGIDLENTPSLAASAEIGFRTAGWFWKGKKLNGLADAGEFKQITKKINGGLNGYEQRVKYYLVAQEVMLIK